MVARRSRGVVSKPQWPSRALDWAYLLPLILAIGFILIIDPLRFLSLLPASPAANTGSNPLTTLRYVDTGDAVRQAVLGIAFGLALLGLLVSSNAIHYIFHRQKLMLLLVIYALLSIAWSSAPTLSLRRSLQFVGLLLVAWCAMRTTSAIQRIVQVLRLIFTSVLCLSFPLVTLKAQMGGIYSHKNTLGHITLLSIALWLPCLGSKESLVESRLAPLVLLLAAFLVVKTGSQTALVTMVLIVGLCVLLKFPVPWEIKLVTTYVPILMVTLWFLNFQQFPLASFMSDVLQRDNTFNGRVPVWQALLNNMRSHPWLGEGYNAFWIPDNFKSLGLIFSNAQWTPLQGHNGYLDILNELGLIGGTLFLLVLIQSVVRAARLYFLQASTGMVFLLLLWALILSNLTESGFCQGTALQWVIFLLTYAAVAGIRPLRVPGRSLSMGSAQGRNRS